MPVARQEDLSLCVLWSLFLSLQPVPCCKEVALYVLRGIVGVFVFFGEAAHPPKQAMPVARQEDLGLCVVWSLSLSTVRSTL